jgi:hypothetical protein
METERRRDEADPLGQVEPDQGCEAGTDQGECTRTGHAYAARDRVLSG